MELRIESTKIHLKAPTPVKPPVYAYKHHRACSCNKGSEKFADANKSHSKGGNYIGSYE